MMEFGIEALASVGPAQEMSPAAWTPAEDPAQSASVSGAFTELMQRGIGEVNDSFGAAETAMRSLAAGGHVELHEVMISLERASLSVQTFMQVRNKLVESYQDLMRMQM